MSNKVKNRWLIAASAVGIHISIGSVYAYSVMTNPVANLFKDAGHEVDSSAIKWAFKIAILLLGLSAAFLGRWVEKVGPRTSGTFAAIFYGAGIIGSGLAMQLESLNMFYFCYGFLGGIGLGLGYITPVSTLVKWFPDKRGLATGMAIMGFGFSALIFGPLMAKLFASIGPANTFYSLGTLYFVLIFASAQYIERPPQGWVPEGFEEKPGEATKIKKDLSNITANESLKTPRFYFIWLMMFINISCGIAVIASASPMMQEKLGYTAMEAAGIVGLIGVFNGLGRLVWSSLSDYMGRANTFILFFTFQIGAFLLLPRMTTELFFLFTLFTVITMYGGGFATLPAFLGDLFGTKQLGAIHGMVLAAWGLAGVVGPTIYDMVKESTGSLDLTLPIFGYMFIFALFISILMKLNIKKLEAANASA